MGEKIEQYVHYAGIFNIIGEDWQGEIVLNQKDGLILLNLAQKLTDKSFFVKPYGTLSIITGKINSGEVVTLFENRCIQNDTKVFQSQNISFRASYMLWGKDNKSNSQYNKMVCILKNAYAWSGLSAFQKTDSGLILLEKSEEKSYDWFGAKITFSTYLNNRILTPPKEEETEIIQRLFVEIEMKEKHDFKDFIDIRNKIISLISFAIKNNVNIQEEYLLDYNDSYIVFDDTVDYHRYYLITSEPERNNHNTKKWNYNFYLEQIPTKKDINYVLTNLEPVFNLYLSLFKYRDMPIEMVFLNIVQALETFHSRFFYEDKKAKYIKSVKDRFEKKSISKNLRNCY